MISYRKQAQRPESQKVKKQRKRKECRMHHTHEICFAERLQDPRFGTSMWWYERRCSTRWSWRGKPLLPFREQCSTGQLRKTG